MRKRQPVVVDSSGVGVIHKALMKMNNITRDSGEQVVFGGTATLEGVELGAVRYTAENGYVIEWRR